MNEASEALRQEPNFISTVLDTVDALIVVFDPGGRIVYFNRACERASGYSFAEVRGRRLWPRLLIPSERAPARARFEELCSRGLPNQFESSWVSKDGERRRIAWSNNVVPDGAGSAMFVIGTGIDITERKRAEEALRESENQFRTLAESMSAAVFIYQGDQIRYANPAAEALTGYSREELARMQFWDFTHPDFRELVKERGLARQRGEPVPTRYEVKIIAKNGDERWFDVTAGVATFEGKPAGLATAFDITDRKRIEEALRHGESRTRALLDAIPDLMFRYRLDGTYVDFHAHQPGDLALPPETIVGAKMDQLPLAREIIDEIKAASRRAVETGQVQTVEYTLNMPAGPQTYEARIVASDREELVSIVRNITKRRQAEDALRRGQENLRALTAQLISAREEESKRLARELHDAFSQRLAVLGMEASALEQDPTLSDSVRQSLRAMGEEIGKLAKDVHQLSRELHPSILDDLGLTAALRAECGAFSRQYSIPVRFEPSAVPDSLSPAVSLGLYRIAQESLRNVGKHARATAVRVTLATTEGTESTAGAIRLTVEDNGCGINLEQIKGRRGLGLVSMEERVRLVEGSLEIRSQPGTGTTVEVRIPVSRSAP